tara:strand:+ start:3041 stop:3538 length:498 start_codon:yes stop_codon:yes gene_type:complete
MQLIISLYSNMIKTWVLHSLLAAITFSIGDLSCKLLLNQSDVDLSVVLAITAIFIGTIGIVYIINRTSQDKELNFLKVFKNKKTFLYLLGFVGFLALGEYYYHSAILHGDNPSFVTAMSSLSIVFIYLISILMYNFTFNMKTLLGIGLTIIGIFIITMYSENKKY